jgi:hypothetical protein
MGVTYLLTGENPQGAHMFEQCNGGAVLAITTKGYGRC